MTNILHIISSSRLEGSVTREIGVLTVAQLTKASPGAKVTKRDLVKTPLPHVGPEFVGALWTPGSPALKLSDELVDELLAADTIVIEAPMYNFGIPSALKAWIDHIARAGRTFSYEGGVPSGKLGGKKVLLVLGRGGVYSVGPFKAMDYQETYLRAVIGFLGVTDIESVYIEGTSMGPEKTAESLAAARAGVEVLTKKAA